MKKNAILTQLALAGIAAGLVSAAPVKASDKAQGSTVHEKSGCGGKGGCGSMPSKAVTDSVKAHKADSAASARHSCRGKNACKSQGGCAMTKKDLEKAAKKQGIPVEKAGQPHSCKGLNACKGLGGCGM